MSIFFRRLEIEISQGQPIRFVLLLLLSSQGQDNYIEDVQEKLNTGSDRLRKRPNKQTVAKTESKKVEVSVPGTFVHLDTYKADIGDDPAAKGHSVHTIEDPTSSKKIEAVFIPKLKRGYFEGCVKAGKKIRMENELDTNSTALRDGQVNESFQDEMGRFNKSDLPEIKEEAETFEQAIKKAPEADQAAEEEEAPLPLSLFFLLDFGRISVGFRMI